MKPSTARLLALGLALHLGVLSACRVARDEARATRSLEEVDPKPRSQEEPQTDEPSDECADRFVLDPEAIEASTDACAYEGDPELAGVAAAACNGIRYLLDQPEAHGGSALILVDMIARRFGIESLLALWDRAEKDSESEPTLDERIFTRLADARCVASAADLERLESPIDRFTSRAIFCRELGFPAEYHDVLRENNALGGYEASHVLLAFFWLEERGCTLPDSDDIRADALAITASLIDSNHDDIRDLELEAAAFLAYEGAYELIPEGFLEGAIRAQSEGGGFSDGAESEENLHASLLGIWYLHELLYPQRRTPLVNPCAR